MENRPRKAKTKSYREINTPILSTLLIAYIAVFVPGCEYSMQNSGGLKQTNVDSMYAQAYRIINEALSDYDPDVRCNAIEVIASTKQYKLMPKVQRLLQDESVQVRFLATLAVGDLEYTVAQKALTPLLRDEDASVRTCAAYAMGKLGSTEYFKVLHTAITSEDQTVRANAAMLLGKSGDRSARRLLYWVLQDHNSDDKAIYQAAESIAMLGDERIYARLWSMLISAYADVRLVGISSMAALGTREATNALITMLDDEVLEIRLAAAEYLGSLRNTAGERKVREVIEKNLAADLTLDQEARDRVNARTALAIGRIRTPALTRHLLKLLKNESKIVRIAAAKAVFQCTME
jgi:HEAT repeat protein